MNAFWDSCVGSELIGTFKNIKVFKITVYTISKPSLYKIQLYELDGNELSTLFHNEKETQGIIEKWINNSPICISFNEHKIVDIGKDFKIPPIKTSFFNKILSPKTSPKSKSPSPK